MSHMHWHSKEGKEREGNPVGDLLSTVVSSWWFQIWAHSLKASFYWFMAVGAPLKVSIYLESWHMFCVWICCSLFCASQRRPRFSQHVLPGQTDLLCLGPVQSSSKTLEGNFSKRFKMGGKKNKNHISWFGANEWGYGKCRHHWMWLVENQFRGNQTSRRQIDWLPSVEAQISLLIGQDIQLWSNANHGILFFMSWEIKLMHWLASAHKISINQFTQKHSNVCVCVSSVLKSLCAHVPLKEDWTHFPPGRCSPCEKEVRYWSSLVATISLLSEFIEIIGIAPSPQFRTSLPQLGNVSRCNVMTLPCTDLLAHWKVWAPIKLFDRFIEPSVLQTSKFLRDSE